MDTSDSKTMTEGSSLARDEEDNSADYEKDSRIEYAKQQNLKEIDQQQILIDINKANSYKWGSQKSKKPGDGGAVDSAVRKDGTIGKDSLAPLKEAPAVESGEDTFDDERDDDDEEEEESYVNQITPDEIERYRNLLELAL